jgi:hypothetical protein
MTVEAERRAMAASEPARRARIKTKEAHQHEREAVVEFVDAALGAGWNWERIGKQLGVSANAIRGYYNRNRRWTHGGQVLIEPVRKLRAVEPMRRPRLVKNASDFWGG